jgi:phosphoglycolate phosphatase-like HAD superfamily hydrolase
VERLVLWDIDQTLTSTVGTGQALFTHALRATTGLELVHMPDLGGRTDRELITSLFGMHGVAMTEPLLESFYAEMAAAAHERSDHIRATGTALAGAHAALTALAAIPGVVQTVVTGNIAPVARLKISLFGLDDHIDFDIGGYGSDSAIRGEIVNLARERAALKHGVTLAGDSVIVIGDTVHDIAGAKFSGAVAIGVATGRTPAADLHAAGADGVLTSLADTAALITVITG